MPQEVLAAPRHDTVAQIVGFENVFDATVTALHSIRERCCAGMKPAVANWRCRSPGPWLAPRSEIAIRAGDIMIATEHAHGLSARNALRGRIESVRREGVTVILGVNAGVTFEVRVTPSAAEELGLVPGRQVWLVIKTYFCNLIERRD
jgi:molybdopterin-binding protein